MRNTTPLLDRIQARIVIDTDGCWVWQGSKCNGYGVVGRGRRTDSTMQTHRAMYEIMVGPVPVGLQLDHLCRNRACCNPAHLEPVTQRENILRGLGSSAQHARQTECLRGHPFDDINTRTTTTGARVCRTCHRERNASYYQKKTAA